jgi:hypothetical protein
VNPSPEDVSYLLSEGGDNVTFSGKTLWIGGALLALAVVVVLLVVYSGGSGGGGAGY